MSLTGNRNYRWLIGLVCLDFAMAILGTALFFYMIAASNNQGELYVKGTQRIDPVYAATFCIVTLVSIFLALSAIELVATATFYIGRSIMRMRAK